MMISILYPERRSVSSETVIGWALDAVANGEAEEFDGTLEGAVAVLEDAGLVTFGGEPEPSEWAERYDALNGAPENDGDR